MVLKQFLSAVSLYLFDRKYSKNSERTAVYLNIFWNVFSSHAKAPLLQISVSHDPSEIMLIVAQEICIICIIIAGTPQQQKSKIWNLIDKNKNMNIFFNAFSRRFYPKWLTFRL